MTLLHPNLWSDFFISSTPNMETQIMLAHACLNVNDVVQSKPCI